MMTVNKTVSSAGDASKFRLFLHLLMYDVVLVLDQLPFEQKVENFFKFKNPFL